MLTDHHDAGLWDTPFAALGGRTPRQWLAPEGQNGFVFHSYVKGAYGERLLENLLPWLNFGADSMHPALLAYWRARGMEKRRHPNADPDRTWFSYLPLRRPDPGRSLPVWYLNHAKGRDILDVEGWGFVQEAARRQVLVLTAENGDDEDIFAETLDAAEAAFPIDRGRVYLVGHSLSGTCAGRLAVAFADKLAGLCMLGSQYGGLDSSAEEIRRAQAFRLPRVDIHGLAERILPYNKTRGPASPKRYPRVTPTDLGLDASFAEQRFWRGLNRCPPIEKEVMAHLDTVSGDPVERALGIPVDRSRVFALGSVRHFAGDILNTDGLAVMRIIGVEGAPHYPSAYAGMLAMDFLSGFSRDATTGALAFDRRALEGGTL